MNAAEHALRLMTKMDLPDDDALQDRIYAVLTTEIVEATNRLIAERDASYQRGIERGIERADRCHLDL